MKVTLIHNPKAGIDTKPSKQQLLTAIRRAGHTVVYRSSREDDWESVFEESADIVAVSGGDGTVGRVIKSLVGRDIPIAVLPAGTANNLAKTLGLTNRPLEELIEGWEEASRLKFDVGLAKGPWGATLFTEGVGMGLFAETLHQLYTTSTIELPKADRPEEEITSAVKLLKERLQIFPAKKLKINLDGEDLSGEYILVEAMNIKYVGPNLSLAPDSDPGDGLLDVVLVSRAEQNKLGNYLSDYIEGQHCQPPLTVRRGQYLQIESEDLLIHIDDETKLRQATAVPGSPTVIEVKAKSHTVEYLAPTGG